MIQIRAWQLWLIVTSCCAVGFVVGAYSGATTGFFGLDV